MACCVFIQAGTMQSVTTVYLFVENIKKSRDWYASFFQVEPSEEYDNFVSFLIGTTFLNLHLADELSPISTGGSVAYWSTKEIDLEIKKALALGAVIYRGPLAIKETHQIIAQIQDPFGNVFGLAELK